MKELRILGPNELGKGILIEMDAGYVSPMDILNESVFKESNMLDYKKPFEFYAVLQKYKERGVVSLWNGLIVKKRSFILRIS